MSGQANETTVRAEDARVAATASEQASGHDDARGNVHEGDSLVKTYVSPAADEMLGEALETPESEGPHEPQLGRPRAQAMSFSSKAKDDSYYAGGNVTPESRFRELQRLTSAYLQHDDEMLLQKAFDFASAAHKGQCRKSGEPFVAHPVEVAIILSDLKHGRGDAVRRAAARHGGGHATPPPSSWRRSSAPPSRSWSRASRRSPRSRSKASPTSRRRPSARCSWP